MYKIGKVRSASQWNEIMKKKLCRSCSSMNLIISSNDISLNSIADNCNCPIKVNCCCQQLKKEATLNITKENEILVDKELENNFSVIQNLDEPRMICTTCNRYSTKVGKKMADGGEWVEKGVSFKYLGSRKNWYLKRHTQSELHIEAKKKKK